MKTFLRFAFAILVASATSAQASPATVDNLRLQLCDQRFVNKSILKDAVVGNESFVKLPAVKRAESRADGVNVKIRVKYDSEKFQAPNVVVFWPENGNVSESVVVGLNPEDNETEANVPSGEYWISLIAYSKYFAQDPFAFLIKEHIQLTDGMVLSFDTAEAVNRISFRPKTPNGETVNISMTDKDGNIIEPGNVGQVYGFTTAVFGPDFVNFAVLHALAAKSKDDDGNIIDGISMGDILVSPVSDRFYAQQYVIMNTLDGEAVFTNLPTLINKSVTVSPDVDYTFIKNDIQPSSKCDQENPNIHEVNLIYGCNNRFIGLTSILSFDITSSNYYCGLVDGDDDANFIALANISNCDQLNVDAPNPIFGITTPPLLTDGLTLPAYIYFDNFALASFNQIKGEGGVYSQARFNDVYTRTVEQTTGIYGNSVPLTSFCPMMTYKNSPEGFVPNFSFSFIGMNGEVRRIDGEAAQLDVKFGGETVCSSLKESTGWCWSWFANGAHRGVYDINVTNDNVMLGNIRGVNTTDIHFDLANDDNPLPPLLQWMQYRNSEGTVTPMLDKAVGSKLLFSAGIFDFNIDEKWQMWFTCREEPVNVKVEYAIHGADTFKELPVEVIADKFFTPGFGHQYEVALDGISEESYLGWFDLRVSLSDKAGNTMTQLFEPAFNIAELAGLETVGSEAETIGLDGRNIIAPAGSLVYDMSGRLVDGRDLAPGVYIVAAPNSITKVVVR